MLMSKACKWFIPFSRYSSSPIPHGGTSKSDYLLDFLSNDVCNYSQISISGASRESEKSAANSEALLSAQRCCKPNCKVKTACHDAIARGDF